MQAASQAFDADPYARDMLELLFDQVPVAIAVLDPTYHVLRYNATWAGYVERYKPSVLPLLQGEPGFFELLPETTPQLEPLFQRALKGETVRVYALGIQTGTKISYWNLAVAPLVHADITHSVLLVSNDVTKQIEAREALQQALIELQRSHEANEQRVEERTRELRTLIRVQQALTSSLNLSDVLHIVAHEAPRPVQRNDAL